MWVPARSWRGGCGGRRRRTKNSERPLPAEYVLVHVHQRTVDDDDDGTAENGHVVDVVDAASEQRGRFDDTHGEAGDLVSIRATVDQENLENPASGMEQLPRRIVKETQRLIVEPVEGISAAPTEENMRYVWTAARVRPGLLLSRCRCRCLIDRLTF